MSRQRRVSKMKFVVTCCIFSVLFMQAATLDPFAGITRLKNTVKSVSNDLTRYKNNLRFNLNTKLSNLKINQMINVNNAVNAALTDTKNAINTAKNEGRDANHCYEPTRQRLGDASKNTFSALDKCVKDQLDTLTPHEQNIESHLNAGQLLLSTLDNIAISCASGTPLQVQACVAGKLPAANESVQNYDRTAKLLKDTGDSLSNSAQTNSVRCFQTPMSKLYDDVSAARISATKCIKDST